MAKKSTPKKPAVKKQRGITNTPENQPKIDAVDAEENVLRGLFVVASHWQSDLKFFKDELLFFHRLIDKYFMWLIEEENIENTRKMTIKLLQMEKQRFSVEQEIANHLKHLARLTENPFPLNAQAYKDVHGNLEISIADFFKNFRLFKRDVFQLTEHIVETEKAKHLLS